jgi:general secretion pathway protein J
MMRRSGCRSRLDRFSAESGFTLIELLVSLVVLGLLTTVLLEGFRFVTRPLQLYTARFEEASRLSVAYGLLRTQLADARPIEPFNGILDEVAFDGRPDRVTFVAAAPRGAAEGGLYLFRLEVISGQLRFGWQLFDGLLPTGRPGNDLVLVSGVRRVDLAYYGPRGSDSKVEWHDEWRQTAYLPSLVRLAFELANGEHPPPLVVAPRLQPLRAIPGAGVAPAAAIR